MKCFLNHSNIHILRTHSACSRPPNVFSETLGNSWGIQADLLGAVMTFGSSLMQPSSSMWTRVARRVTTPFPLHTLLGSRSENIRNKSLTSTAPHCFSRHSRVIFYRGAAGNLGYLLPHAPNDQNRTVTSKPGHQINILWACKTNCNDHTVRAGSGAAGVARRVCFLR